MTIRLALRSLLLSWDWPVAAAIALAFYFVLPREVPLAIAKDMFTIGVSVLALVFSVFAASLAVLVTGGDNEFVSFLQESGTYQRIAWTFRSTLIILFAALAISIALAMVALVGDDAAHSLIMPKWVITIYAFLGLYGLFAAIAASFDAVQYAEFRARYLLLKGKVAKSDDSLSNKNGH